MQSVAAVMIILSFSTSQTPKDAGDFTQVMASLYPSMADCSKDLNKIPSVQAEVDFELERKVRVIWSCVPLSGRAFDWGPSGSTEYTYSWTKGTVTDLPPVENSLVRTGQYRGR
jgi:hypothetical protein